MSLTPLRYDSSDQNFQQTLLSLMILFRSESILSAILHLSSHSFIKIDGKVYSTIDLANSHPGGPLVVKVIKYFYQWWLNHTVPQAFGGRDATEAYFSYHRRAFPHNSSTAMSALAGDRTPLLADADHSEYLELCKLVEQVRSLIQSLIHHSIIHSLIYAQVLPRHKSFAPWHYYLKVTLPLLLTALCSPCSRRVLLFMLQNILSSCVSYPWRCLCVCLFLAAGSSLCDCLWLCCQVVVILSVTVGLELYMHLTRTYHWSLACGLGFAMAMVGINIQHDANHGSVSKSAWVNRLLGLTQNWIGGSSLDWIHQHNVRQGVKDMKRMMS